MIQQEKYKWRGEASLTPWRKYLCNFFFSHQLGTQNSKGLGANLEANNQSLKIEINEVKNKNAQ